MLKQVINNCNRIRNRLSDEDAKEKRLARERCINTANGLITAAKEKMEAAQEQIDAYTALKDELIARRDLAAGFAALSLDTYTKVSTCVPGMKINNQDSLVDDIKCMVNYVEGTKKAIKECDKYIKKYTGEKEDAEKEKLDAESALRAC